MDAKTEQQHGATRAPRVEDDVLLRGRGRYVADTPLPNQAYAFFVRAPHAFASIVAVDFEAALRAPGVVGVLTAADMGGIGGIGRHPPLVGRGGKPLIVPHRPALAAERVLHIGEPVAMVVAESAAAAQDAAELVAVEYDPLTAVTDARAALAPGAPQIWPEAPGNLAIDWPGPAADPAANAREIDAIFAAAKYVARIAVMNQRIVVASMEPRGATASYDAAADIHTLRVCSQGTTALRENLVAVMKVPKERLRVLTDDVGGAFGLKTGPYPEYVAQMVGAKKFGRPIHWMSGRSEAFLSDNQARDIYSEAELALDQRGRFLALRIRNTGNLGAYIGAVGANIPSLSFTRCLPGMYDIRHIDIVTRCAFTNTLPTAPYRGAGRPEANYTLERVVEEAARVTGIDPVELRRRNLIRPSAMPYKTAVGTTYDSGDFAPMLDKALALSGYDGFKAAPPRSKVARPISRHRGVLHAGTRRRHAAGRRVAHVPRRRHADGQSQCAIDRAGARIGVRAPRRRPPRHCARQDRSPARRFGAGDRRLRFGRLALGHDRRRLDRQVHRPDPGKGQARSRRCCSRRRKATSSMNWPFRRRRHRSPHLAVRACGARGQLKKQGTIEEDLDTRATTETPLTFPNGVHIAEVEIDPETGHLDIVAYTAVDDCGNVLDHMIVEGQLHGALAQGLGQALMEQVFYDEGNGQLVTGSFMDYAMPRADDMPPIRDALVCVPATTNPLGVKGVGEAGTTASIAAVMNAVADAIPGGAAAHLDMPASAARLWEACRRAKAAATRDQKPC